MNKFLFYCLLLLAPISISFAQSKAVVSGKIQEADVDKVLLEVNPLYVESQGQSLEAEVKDGAFEFEVKWEEDVPQVVYLKYKEQTLPLYLESGDALEVNFEQGNLVTTAAFSGTGAEHNQFLAGFQEKFAADFDIPTMEQIVLKAQIDALEMELFDKQLTHKKMVKEADQTGWSKAFKTYLNNRIKYNYFNNLFAYPIVRGNSSKGSMVENLPTVMLDSVTPEMANNDAALVSEHYRSFLVYYLTYYASKANRFQKFAGINPSLTAKYRWGKENMQGESWAYVITAFVNDNGKDAQGSLIKQVYDSVKSAEDGMPYAAVIKRKFGDKMSSKALAAATKERMAKAKIKNKNKGTAEKGSRVGKSVPFKLTNLEGKEITLDEFKGKVVYIDFWASWCGPCRKQFPFAKELKNKLTKKQKKKVEFLYISIDNGEKPWKSAIERMKIEGYHVLSPGGWKSDVCKYFKIRSIPRYMLLDKKGRIADSSAKRPGQQGILEDIERLLSEKK